MKKRGFTILEIIISITILASAMAFGLLYYQTTNLRSDLNTQADILVSYLRLAQSNAQTGRDAFTSVHLGQNSYITFSGIYDSQNPENYEIELPPSIRINNFNLNGATTDIVFTPPHGTTNNYGTFDLISDQLSTNITINISQIGSINY